MHNLWITLITFSPPPIYRGRPFCPSTRKAPSERTKSSERFFMYRCFREKILNYFAYQRFSKCCSSRLTSVIPVQQPRPKPKGLLLVVTSFTILVFKPTAAIAITMKNLLSHLSGAKASAATPTLIASVVISEANTK